MDLKYLNDLIDKSTSLTELINSAFGYYNGFSIKKMDIILSEFDIDKSLLISKFKEKRVKYKKITKVCPVCESLFETVSEHKSEKTTCSHSCSNTYFNGVIRNKTENLKRYRTICFKHHDKQCVICSESKMIDVHHYDGDRKNNDPRNLVPLCPTHHKYWHSRYRYEIKDVVDMYVDKFKKKFEKKNKIL